MAGKLIIRRKGGCLPTCSLALVSLSAIVSVWLSTAGLPGPLLRYLERQAAAAGIPLRIQAVKFTPGSGIAFRAEGISMQLEQPGAPAATLQIPRARVGFGFFQLLTGHVLPGSVDVRGAELRLPLSDNPQEQLAATGLSLQGGHSGSAGTWQFQLAGCVQGIEVDLRATIPDSLLEGGSEKTPETSEAESPTPGERLAEIRPQLMRAYREIAAQQWETAPTLQGALNLADPESPRAFLRAKVPAYDIQDYHFRDVVLDSSYGNHTVNFNRVSFRTVNPDTEVDLQGGYDTQNRLLDFNLYSNASLVAMLRSALGDDAPAAVKAFRHLREDTPRISLQGRVDFTEDYALNGIDVRGRLEQGACAFNDSEINHILLSFYLQDGNFNINELSMDFPNGGKLIAEAASQDGTGSAHAELTLPTEDILKLAANVSGLEIALPEGLSIGGSVNLSAAADMSVARFIPGKTQPEELVPTLHSARLALAPDSLAYADTKLAKPRVELRVEGTDFPAPQGEPLRLRSLVLDAAADSVSTGSAESPLTVQAPAVHAELAGLELAPEKAEEGTVGSLKARVAAAGVESKDARVQDAVLTLDGANALNLQKSWQELLAGCRAELAAAALEAGKGGEDDFTATDFKLTAHAQDAYNAAADISVTTGGQVYASRLAATQQGDGTPISFSIPSLRIPLAALAPVLGINEAELKEIRLPALVEVEAAGTISPQDGKLSGTHARVHIPELRRTPYAVPANRGQQIPVALTAEADLLTNADGDICYHGTATISHSSGKLDLTVQGNASKYVQINGESDMLVSTIDCLIDDVDAHAIMRDFRFHPGSKTLVHNIDTRVDYANGIHVVSHCDADISESEYMQGVVQDITHADGRPTGREQIRTDLQDRDPLTSFHSVKAHVDVDVQLGAKAADGSPLPDRQLVTLSDIHAVYDNRPWLQRRGIQGGEAKSTLTGKRIHFNLDDCFIVLEDISGQVYPAYAFGTFYSPLLEFMKGISMPLPAQVETKRCVFPISKTTKEPMKATIKASSANPCTYHFLGTDIPLQDFSGFIDITDDYVFLDRMNAKCWGGVLNVSTKLGISGGSTTIDGYAEAKCMNLQQIGNSYGAKLNPALCSGTARFRSPSPDLAPLTAYGELHVVNGDLLQLGLFSPINDLITDIPGHLFKLQDSLTNRPEDAKPGLVRRGINQVFSLPGKIFSNVGKAADQIPLLNHFITYDIQDAHSKFKIANGHLTTQGMKAVGTNLNVALNMDIDLDTLTLSGNMWPKISSVPTLIISPITFLSDFMIDIDLYGKVDEIKWRFGLDDKLSAPFRHKEAPDTSISDQPQKPGERPAGKREKH